MPISNQDFLSISSNCLSKLIDSGLYITSAQNRVRYYGEDRYTVPLSASPVQTSGSDSALEVITESVIESLTDYYSSAFSVSSDGTLAVVNRIKLGAVYIYSGSGVPSIPAPNGSLFLRDDAVSGSFYVRESQGWTLK